MNINIPHVYGTKHSNTHFFPGMVQTIKPISLMITLGMECSWDLSCLLSKCFKYLNTSTDFEAAAYSRVFPMIRSIKFTNLGMFFLNLVWPSCSVISLTHNFQHLLYARFLSLFIDEKPGTNKTGTSKIVKKKKNYFTENLGSIESVICSHNLY